MKSATGGRRRETSEGVDGAALLQRLQAHALTDEKLSPTQIRAIELLLRRLEDAEAEKRARDDEEAVIVRIEQHIVYPPAADG